MFNYTKKDYSQIELDEWVYERDILLFLKPENVMIIVNDYYSAMLLVEGKCSHRLGKYTLVTDIINYKKITAFVPESQGNKKCVICYYWYHSHKLKFQSLVCSNCRNLLMTVLGINSIMNINVKGKD